MNEFERLYKRLTPDQKKEIAGYAFGEMAENIMDELQDVNELDVSDFKMNFRVSVGFEYTYVVDGDLPNDVYDGAIERMKRLLNK
jgi:hypothetical protein